MDEMSESDGNGVVTQIFGAFPEKPLWRGRLHQIAFFLTLPAGFWLLAGATSTAARVAVAVYWASLAGLFGASASYHLLARSETSVKWLRRLDHSMIFVLIAGSYTPFCLLVLPRVWGIPLLVAMWVSALAGIIMKMIRVSTHGGKSGSWLYVVLGWSALIALPKLISELDGVRVALLIGGGVLYTVGAVVLGTRRPNPNPRVFGYHEVWHAFTIAAGACHFVAVALIVR
jgi:hemolysin III